MKNMTMLMVLLWFFPGFLRAADVRTVPIDVYVILDVSSAIKNKSGEAVKWLCDHVVDEMLQDGDTLTILAAGERATALFSEPLSSADTKEAAKQAFRSAAPTAASADYAGGLREAVARQGSGRRISYTLLVIGSGSPTAPGGLASLLRYSRVQEFSGWRVLTVGLNMDRQVREAAAAYTR
jgi:hypothetical protein